MIPLLEVPTRCLVRVAASVIKLVYISEREMGSCSPKVHRMERSDSSSSIKIPCKAKIPTSNFSRNPNLQCSTYLY